MAQGLLCDKIDMLLDMKYFYEVNALLGEKNCSMLDFYVSSF